MGSNEVCAEVVYVGQRKTDAFEDIREAGAPLDVGDVGDEREKQGKDGSRFWM